MLSIMRTAPGRRPRRVECRSRHRKRAACAGLLAWPADRGYLEGLGLSSLRLAAQDVALSRRKQGFEFPRERQHNCSLRLSIRLDPFDCPGRTRVVGVRPCVWLALSAWRRVKRVTMGDVGVMRGLGAPVLFGGLQMMLCP